MKEMVEKLKELGFNSYEAKVYLALLKKYPATGYEVSQLADIPQSRAYDALKSLSVSKVVFPSDDKPQKYSPISPKELTKRFKRQINSTVEFLEKSLPEVKEDYDEPVHNISGYENIIKKLKEIIKSSKESIYLEIWSDDFKHLEKYLSAAYDKGVDIKIVAYNGFKTNFGVVYDHEGAKELENSVGSRLIYFLSDDEECIFGKIESQVIWTKNEQITFLVKEFIVHDMYLLDVGKNFPEQLKYFYGPEFKKLKEIILTRNSNYNIH